MPNPSNPFSNALHFRGEGGMSFLISPEHNDRLKIEQRADLVTLHGSFDRVAVEMISDYLNAWLASTPVRITPE